MFEHGVAEPRRNHAESSSWFHVARSASHQDSRRNSNNFNVGGSQLILRNVEKEIANYRLR